MKIKRIRNSRDPLICLPDDYASLTSVGKHEARVNACSQWLLNDKHRSGMDLVRSVEAIDWLYLRDLEHSLFYDGRVLPNPQFHHEIYSATHEHPWVACAAPRGYAKSGAIKKLIITWLVTAANYKLVYTTSTTKVLRAHFPAVMRELEVNRPLIEDFGVPNSSGVKHLRPGRGRPWSLEGQIVLMNGSELMGFTFDSRMRGLRPRKFIFDDPEYDPSGSTDMSNARREIEEKLFKVIMPMIRPDDDCGVLWTGTIISRRHFLSTALAVDAEGMAVDPRFNYWMRLFFEAGSRLPDGGFDPLWPEMYSSDDLVLREKMMGRAHFLSEMMNNPGAGETVLFPLDDQKHGYTVSDDDGKWLTDPRSSRAVVTFHRLARDGSMERVSMEARELLKDAVVFSCSDWAETAGPSSDFQSCVVMALTPKNELFVLEVWARRAPQSVLVQAIIESAYRWRVDVVGIEAFSVYQSLRHQVDTELRQKASQTGYYPRVAQINPRHMSKASKISGIAWRFGDDHSPNDKIKYPLDVFGRSMKSDPMCTMLFDQTMGFNPSADGGGLPHDDVLDCVSMSQLLIPGLPKSGPKPDPESDVLDEIMAGRLSDAHGHSNLQKIDLVRGVPRGVREKVFDVVRQRHAEDRADVPNRI